MINVVETTTPDLLQNSDSIGLQTIATHIFQGAEWEQIVPPIFNDGSTTPPLDLPPVQVDANFIEWTLRGVGWSMSLFLMTLSISFCFWSYFFREARVVKASQPIFLYMICAGCFLMSFAIIFSSIDDEIASTEVCSAFCIVTPWFFCVGWILSFSALFAKTYRVIKVFHNARVFSRVKVTVWDVIKPVVLLLGVTTLCLSLWTALEPPAYERRTFSFDVYGRSSVSKGSCNYVGGGLPYALAVGVILLGTLIYTVRQAYVARNISTEFSESEYIFLVLVAIFLTSILGIPILILVKNSPKARFVVTSLVVFLNDFSILFLIFVPKIRQREREEIEKSSASLNRMERRISYVSSPGSPGERRISYVSSPGSPGIVVSGIDMSQSGSSIDHNSLDSDSDDNEGIRIMSQPKELERLRKEVVTLKAQIVSLKKKSRRRRYYDALDKNEGSTHSSDTLNQKTKKEQPTELFNHVEVTNEKTKRAEKADNYSSDSAALDEYHVDLK
jgi:hypothetical protein